jgi:hypothetical protein
MVVVVYRAESINNNKPEKNMILESLTLNPRPSRDARDVKAQQAPHQGETKRLRQLERRKSKRRKDLQSKADEKVFPEEEEKPISSAGPDTERSFRGLSVSKPNDQPHCHEQLVAGSKYQIALKEFIVNLDLNLENDDEREEVLKILCQEILRRPRQKTISPEVVTVVESPQTSIPEATPQILEAASRTIFRPDSAKAQNEILAGICGGVADYSQGRSVHLFSPFPSLIPSASPQPPKQDYMQARDFPKLTNYPLHPFTLPSQSNAYEHKSGMYKALWLPVSAELTHLSIRKR